MKNVSIILAGGSGRRTGNDIPKQFLQVAGKTILEHTTEKFDTHPAIDEITIVVPEKELEHAQELFPKEKLHKKLNLIIGGKERYHSTLSALDFYRNETCNLLIHDAARPLVTHRIISDVIEALQKYHAVNVAIPATDTIIETNSTQEVIERIPMRDFLYMVQTPQGFYNKTLARAYEKALQDPDFKTTDDCSVVKNYLPEEAIGIIQGDTKNLKITHAEDIALLEYLLQHV